MAVSEVVDVLIIGSGASGGPFAWSLSQAQGLKVACLEQGDWDQPASEVDIWTRNESWGDGTWKRLIKPTRQPGVNYFDNGYPYDHTDSYWEPILGNHVGGAMVHYAGGWSRLTPSHFLQRTLTGVGDDWPIRYEDLAPWYDFNDNFVGISGVPGNPAYPNRHVTLLPVPGQSESKTQVQLAADKLGWHYFPGERAVITVPFKGRKPGTREAKNRADIVHWPEAIRNGVVLKTRATVREITVDKDGRADGALYFDADGQLHEQKARLVVVACNGIGTPRLLLNSRSSRFPQGLANSSGLVGRGLMSHPLNSVVGVLENDNPSPRVGVGGGGSIDEFEDIGFRGGAVGGFTLSTAGFTGPVAVALGTPAESIATVIPAALEQGPRGTGQELPWGRAHHAAFQERFQYTATVNVTSSELAEDANRVELHSTLTDDFGTPAPKLTYSRSENTQKLLAYAMERGEQLLEAMGATEIVSAGMARDFVGRGATPGHYLGTARMGVDPERSVVDQWGRAHDVKNLFIIDGSVFTTSAVVTPTSTIQANALRIADYVKKNANELLTA